MMIKIIAVRLTWNVDYNKSPYLPNIRTVRSMAIGYPTIDSATNGDYEHATTYWLSKLKNLDNE